MNWPQLISGTRAGDKKTSSSDENRSAFEQDYDRIIFSQPFRKLQDKTQVFPLPEQDFVHTRLTHSLEVSSVGRSLGKKVGKILIDRYPELKTQNISQYDFGAVVSAASLAHDLGNPPFGHSGEDAISGFFSHDEKGLFFQDKVNSKEWADLTNFEGNAQGFRILNKGKYQGLKLTTATLASFTKYPRESLINPIDKDRRSQNKYGFFQSEKKNFTQVASDVGVINLGTDNNLVWSRHPLAFLVEAADDICYHIIDLEDGCNLGLVTFEQTVELLALILKNKLDIQKLNKLNSISEKIGLLRALTIGMLIDQCTELFADQEKDMLSATYDRALVDEIPGLNGLNEIMKISIEKIYRSQVVIQTEAAGFEVLSGLLEEFTHATYYFKFEKDNYSPKHQSIIRLLPTDKLTELESVNSIYEVILICLDYISGMTDSFALLTFRRIKGISLPKA
ncbi:MAG: dNTP triphosphohydrolase [Bacteroidetes bacterium]|nr:dNTP triphosphohydrolase [Bacteroidota bacterium]